MAVHRARLATVVVGWWRPTVVAAPGRRVVDRRRWRVIPALAQNGATNDGTQPKTQERTAKLAAIAASAPIVSAAATAGTSAMLGGCERDGQ